MPDPRHRGLSREQGDLSAAEGREGARARVGKGRAEALTPASVFREEVARERGIYGGWGAMAEHWDKSLFPFFIFLFSFVNSFLRKKAKKTKYKNIQAHIYRHTFMGS